MCQMLPCLSLFWCTAAGGLISSQSAEMLAKSAARGIALRLTTSSGRTSLCRRLMPSSAGLKSEPQSWQSAKCSAMPATSPRRSRNRRAATPTALTICMSEGAAVAVARMPTLQRPGSTARARRVSRAIQRVDCRKPACRNGKSAGALPAWSTPPTHSFDWGCRSAARHGGQCRDDTTTQQVRRSPLDPSMLRVHAQSIRHPNAPIPVPKARGGMPNFGTSIRHVVPVRYGALLSPIGRSAAWLKV